MTHYGILSCHFPICFIWQIWEQVGDSPDICKTRHMYVTHVLCCTFSSTTPPTHNNNDNSSKLVNNNRKNNNTINYYYYYYYCTSQCSTRSKLEKNNTNNDPQCRSFLWSAFTKIYRWGWEASHGQSWTFATTYLLILGSTFPFRAPGIEGGKMVDGCPVVFEKLKQYEKFCGFWEICL